jgi:hypothetical protein
VQCCCRRETSFLYDMLYKLAVLKGQTYLL